MKNNLNMQYLETEHGTFTPLYTYESYSQETNTYINLVITKTAQEVYNEWLANKDKPPKPTEEELLKAKISELDTQLAMTTVESTMAMAQMQANSANAIAELTLAMSMLGGGANV